MYALWQEGPKPMYAFWSSQPVGYSAFLRHSKAYHIFTSTVSGGGNRFGALCMSV